MEKMITVLMVEPGRHPYLRTVVHVLETLQALVGDMITCSYPWEDEIGLIAGDNSLSDERLEWNRIIDDYNIIRGNFYLVGLSRDDFTDIPMDLAKKYAELFWMPESFINIGGSLMVIREDDGTTPSLDV